MSQTLDVLYDAQNIVRFVVAQLTKQRFIDVGLGAINLTVLKVLAQLYQMIEDNFHIIMADILNVQIELLYGVCVIVTAITFQLNNIVIIVVCARRCDIFELIFIPQAALLYVIDEIELLQVLIGFAVQLKIGFQICFIVAQSTNVIIIDNCCDVLRTIVARSIHHDVIVELIKTIRIEFSAYETREKSVWIEVLFDWWLQSFGIQSLIDVLHRCCSIWLLLLRLLKDLI
jgi:hypothetical protein